ncbi:MAG TPA: TrbG/VirB9 family P-type conjugative transfer protein [Steroidobacteraceae bacterium]|nr:TrbG/VirB9 family P-type conjugative transfer protein [Steroidobacteraceae bacterium]
MSMRVRGAACAVLWWLASLCLAGTVPDPGSGDRRIRVTSYVADAVYPLRGYVGFQIDLEFEPGETFTGLGAGDLESLTYAAQANHLFLKPRASGIDTNLTVLTSRRTYHFDYSVTARRPDPDGQDVIYVLRFTYPPPPAPAADAVGQRLRDAGTVPRNLDYWYRGSPALKPSAAWDDGVHTHLRFGAQQELPAIFLRNDDGSESLVNSTIAGGEVVVHRVSRRLIVRRGKLTGCIVNAAFGGGGEHTTSGTVTPAVERLTREAPR